MQVTCARVPREKGEAVRQQIAAQGNLNTDYQITSEDEWVFIPIDEVESFQLEYPIVTKDIDPRETQTLPADILGFEPSYERLGDIVIIDEEDPDQANQIASAVMESSIPAKTVVNRQSKIKGKIRTRDWEIIKGNGTETVHREYGHTYKLDISEVYFSPRLATERHRVVTQVEPNERIMDMFAGVGPFVIPCAKRGKHAVGVDINATAIDYLRENAEINSVTSAVTAIHGDVRDLPPDYDNWAHRIIMNLPHSADEYLSTAYQLAAEECIIHYYDIQPEAAPFEESIQTIKDALSDRYSISVTDKRIVRSYSPTEVNVCLDVQIQTA
ncbi:MAG: class I SAM-dependent methyltransferase family protein [Halobacteriaceae archaeon]